MFDQLVSAAAGARHAAAAGAWARVENAACARRLAAIADELDRAFAADGSAEREQWCIDNWDIVAAAVAAEHNVSLGVASHQLFVARALRERLPRLAAVFATGAVSYRLVTAVVSRTRVVSAPGAMTQIDAAVAAHISEWGSLSAAKSEAAIDYWVDRYDPAALRRTEVSARDRHVDVAEADDGSGVATVEAVLFVHDAEALDARLDAMAAAVCARDPRTAEQRRADSLGAIAHGGDRLICGCDDPECGAGGVAPSAVVVHTIAEEASLSDNSLVRMDGEPQPGPTREEMRDATIAELLGPRPGEAQGPAATTPAAILGGGLLPAPLLAAKIAPAAKVVPIIHPGDAPPENRRTPTDALAWFVRCRDMTCRFPGCDEPATHCDLDHTIAYPEGPTQASNIKCVCRKHHLLKTFCGWCDEQLPDGTVIWTSPGGPTYTTYPGSRLLFPSLCEPTAPVAVAPMPDTGDEVARGARTLAMPRRSRTRAENLARAIAEERRRNQADADRRLAERNRPPPY